MAITTASAFLHASIAQWQIVTCFLTMDMKVMSTQKIEPKTTSEEHTGLNGYQRARLAQIVPNLLFLHLRVIDVHKRPFSLEILDKGDIVFLAALSLQTCKKKTYFFPWISASS